MSLALRKRQVAAVKKFCPNLPLKLGKTKIKYTVTYRMGELNQLGQLPQKNQFSSGLAFPYPVK